MVTATRAGVVEAMESALRLVEQFRVQASDGQEHTVACFQGSCERPADPPGRWERVDAMRLYRLNGAQEVRRVDDETFLTDDGRLLRRMR
jgi:hypothetical protein